MAGCLPRQWRPGWVRSLVLIRASSISNASPELCACGAKSEVLQTRGQLQTVIKPFRKGFGSVGSSDQLQLVIKPFCRRFVRKGAPDHPQRIKLFCKGFVREGAPEQQSALKRFCTGTEWKLLQTSSSLSRPVSKPFGKVVVRERAPDQLQSASRNSQTATYLHGVIQYVSFLIRASVKRVCVFA